MKHTWHQMWALYHLLLSFVKETVSYRMLVKVQQVKGSGAVGAAGEQGNNRR